MDSDYYWRCRALLPTVQRKNIDLIRDSLPYTVDEKCDGFGKECGPDGGDCPVIGNGRSKGDFSEYKPVF